MGILRDRNTALDQTKSTAWKYHCGQKNLVPQRVFKIVLKRQIIRKNFESVRVLNELSALKKGIYDFILLNVIIRG